MYTERKVRQRRGACCLAKEKKGEEWAPRSGSSSLGRKKVHRSQTTEAIEDDLQDLISHSDYCTN